ncbi:helix-turn-helix domain-containing protein [Parabacteroides pacaensis]|uniref:helix-turn-helix domain-containing protein n=1 Tax=Parabacteroides pacaensis TaxID=2086575 RepID=UPI00131A65C2|nr:helix-turn-helix transcriptional regulator [Parabacteroides pacaensis]
MIREAIKNRMKELNITQVQLADELGVNRSSLTAQLNGSRPIPFKTLEAICKYLKLELKPI